ncbi:MAG TPA: glycosyltransferase family 9 protein [Vicinamibacterales bacterium]
MGNTLILKLNATGDVVRTSTLLHRLDGHVTWVTDGLNRPLVADGVRCLSWEERELANDRKYDLAINLEDDVCVARFLKTLDVERVYGACLDGDGSLTYTEDASPWFDMSLSSRHGRQRADALKLQNRRTYQDLVFSGLGWEFRDEPYRLPATPPSPLQGDVAVSTVAGPVWPMKAWAYYDELIARLRAEGLVVNVLPRRPTLLEHLADVRGHRCLVSGDSLPMHLALGSGVRCVTLFNCTSPWEIHDYGLQTKLVSPLLERHFYQRTFDPEATRAIPVEDVLRATLEHLR